MGRTLASAKGRGGRGVRLLSLVAVLLRILVVLVSAQTTGALHVAADVLEELQGEAAHDDCDDDDDGPGCPPGCPSCHHVHGGLATSGDVTPGRATLPPPRSCDEAAPWTESSSLPRGAPSSVFRPPRRPSFSA